MGRDKIYFRQDPNTPAPLTAARERRVRFEEVDALGMVWHGRYPSFLEDGRIAFGDRYGLSYSFFLQQKVMAPIMRMHLDYRAPLRFDRTIRIEAALHWNEAMRLDFSYTIRDDRNLIAATGYTVQTLTDPDGSVLLIPPDWIIEFRENWRSGRLLRP
jgi:acyl-CoA thioester hydrolase